MRRVILLFNQSNTFGLSQDAALIETALKEIQGETFEVHRMDPLQPPQSADIVIHLEVPHPVWFPWAPVQIWMINPEWCVSTWSEYRSQFTELWVKEKDRVSEFGPTAVHMPWAIRGPLKPLSSDVSSSALWVLGGSLHKHSAANALLPIWPEDCPVTVTTTMTEADLSGSFPSSVSIERGFLTAAHLETLNLQSSLHIAISAAEGFGFTAAQAEGRGASLLINTLPVYKETFGNKPYCTFIETPVVSTKEHCGQVADFSGVTTEMLRESYKTALKTRNSELAIQTSNDRYTVFIHRIGQRIVASLKNSKETRPQLPPVLDLSDCPPISVLTLTYNRRNFIDLAFINMITTDYPASKIQWVIVDDSNNPLEMVLDKIKAFEERQPGFEITYVPLTTKRSIGYKRNKAVNAAKHSICVNMDDDDVYPVTSFRRRVAWLLSNPSTEVVGCTMIAMYDLQQGISAVNVPPWALEQRQRVSEASFCFYKSYATRHPFPDQQLSEGESFVPSCKTFLEIPPQQILVALNHGTNTSKRILAGKAQSGCFWGWPKPFLVWLHKLVGVEVEESI